VKRLQANLIPFSFLTVVEIIVAVQMMLGIPGPRGFELGYT
jgi:hypothetical protein